MFLNSNRVKYYVKCCGDVFSENKISLKRRKLKGTPRFSDKWDKQGYMVIGTNGISTEAIMSLKRQGWPRYPIKDSTDITR